MTSQQQCRYCEKHHKTRILTIDKFGQLVERCWCGVWYY